MQQDSRRTENSDDGDDPLIDEIHEIRRRLAEKYGNDPVRIGEHLMEFQQQFKDRLVSKRDLACKSDDGSAA
jgi:hypothetical protein